MRTGALALVATAGLLLAASLFFADGSSDGRLAWIGGGAVLAAVAAGAAALWGLLPAPSLGREGLAFAGLAASFVVWNGLSILWSAAPDRSWDYFNRGLVYLSFAVVGAFVGSAVAPRFLAWLVGGLVSAACLWALAGKAVPALYEDYGRFARLRSPVGYWNALALVAVFGLPLALWAATRPGHARVVRAGAVAVLSTLIVTIVLTYSRGGILAALVAIGLWLYLSGERFESVSALVWAGAPATAVLAVALSLPGIAEDDQSHAVRARDGAWFALALVLGAALAFATAFLVRYRPSPERRLLLLRLAAVVAAAALAVGAGIVASQGNPLRGDDVVTQNPGRLTEGALNNRWAWWKEAWEGFEGQPLAGTGAASFELLHRRLRTSPIEVTEPHDLPLQFAAETGLVGLLLAGGAAGAALLGAARALRRLHGAERAAAGALVVALPTFLVHGALDYDWDFVALCGPLFFLTGALLAAGRAPLPIRRLPLWMLAAILVAWAVLYSIAAPRVAAGRVDHAYAEIERGSVEDAVKSAKSAHSLDPLSIEPLHAWAAAEEASGRPAKARRIYLRAVDLQPLNWVTWYELGLFDLELADREAARRALERAAELDPYGPTRDELEKLAG